MIPASYLYKDAFRQAWYDADIEAAAERHALTPRKGLTTPLRKLSAWIANLRHTGAIDGQAKHA